MPSDTHKEEAEEKLFKSQKDREQLQWHSLTGTEKFIIMIFFFLIGEHIEEKRKKEGKKLRKKNRIIKIF